MSQPWEFLPKDQARAWRAEKWKKQAIERLRPPAEDDLESNSGPSMPQQPPGVPPMSPVAQAPGVPPSPTVAPGFASGGKVWDRVKKTLGKADPTKAIPSAAKKVGKALDWYDDEVTMGKFNPLAYILGAAYATGIPDVELSRLARGKAPYNPEGGPRFDLFTNPSKLDDLFRERMKGKDVSGIEKIGAKTLADPLTYGPGISKGLSKLGKPGKAASAVFDLPGKGVDKALSGVGKGVGKALGPLGKPSTRALSTRAGDDLSLVARKLVDEVYDPAKHTGMDDPMLIADIRKHLTTLRPTNVPTGPDELDTMFRIRELTKIDPKARLDTSDYLKALRKGTTGVGSADEFIAKSGAIGGDTLSKSRSANIRADRKGLAKGLNVADDVWRNVWSEGLPGKINRWGSAAILGTPMFPIGNVAETRFRTGAAGLGQRSVSAEAGDQIFKGVGKGLPREAFLDEKVSSAMRATGLSQSAGAVGKGFTIPGADKLTRGRIDKFHPMDIISGQKFLRASGEATAPLQRGAFATAYEEALQETSQNVGKWTAEIQQAGFSPQVAAQAAEVRAKDAAAAMARERMAKVMPGYGTESAIEAGIKQLVPFAGYELHRPGYLARTVADNPGMATAYNRYREETDGGKIRVNDSLTVNPLAGSVLAFPLSLGKQDYPNYTEGGVSGEIEAWRERAGRLGFYPGLPLSIAEAGIRMAEGQPPEVGALAPSTTTMGLGALQGLGAVPGVKEVPGVESLSNAAVNIEDNILGFGQADTKGNRFREMAIRRILADRGIDPDQATPEQRRDAAKMYGLGNFATAASSGITRTNPKGAEEYKREGKEAALAAGVPQELIDKTVGNPVFARDPNTQEYILDAATRRGIQDQNPEWSYWQAANDPLKRPADLKQTKEVQQFFELSDALDKETEAALTEMYDKAVEKGWSGKKIREARSAINREAAIKKQGYLDTLPLAKDALDSSPEAKARRDEQAKRTGRPAAVDKPKDAVAKEYWSIDPEQNPETGRLDFEARDRKREELLAGLDPETRDYVVNQYRRERFADNPKLKAYEDQFNEAAEAAKAYYDIPRYRGLSKEDENALDMAQRQIAELRIIHPYIPYEGLIAKVMQVNKRGGILLMRASTLRNPERTKARRANPLIDWYNGGNADADLGDLVLDRATPFR